MSLLKCPFCLHKDTRVTDSRGIDQSRRTWRRRRCASCGAKFTTYEEYQADYRETDFLGEAVDDQLNADIRSLYARVACKFRMRVGLETFFQRMSAAVRKEVVAAKPLGGKGHGR